MSRPAFDPNSFSSRISKKEWVDLINDLATDAESGHPESFPPGSVFKIIMTIADPGGILKPGYTDFCSGSTVMYGRSSPVTKAGHGTVDLHNIIQSCNVLYHLGQKMGIDKIAHWAQHGVGPEDRSRFAQRGYGTHSVARMEEARVGLTGTRAKPFLRIGQGVSLTLIQTARAFGGFGMGGIFKTLMSCQPKN